jgi:hypothetical protein
MLVLGLTTTFVVNAQVAIVKTSNNQTYRLERLDDGSDISKYRIYAQHLNLGIVSAEDTLLMSEFTHKKGGYRIISGNLMPKSSFNNDSITQNKLTGYYTTAHKHKKHQIHLDEQDKMMLSVGAGLYLGWRLIRWIMPKSTTHVYDSPPSYGGGGCMAIAASTGQRCKRSASPGSIYCWQHQ